MALRNIRVIGDEVLKKQTREVKEITPKIIQLIDDMYDTMYDAMGVGLAAPQIGILKKIVVIERGEGPFTFINPVIVETDGEQDGDEGCLSVPGKFGRVIRPNYVKVRAFDEEMNEFELEAEGFFARAICHECDHLEGKLYVEKVIGELRDAPKEEVEVEEEE